MPRRCNCGNVDSCRSCRIQAGNQRFYQLINLRRGISQAVDMTKAVVKHIAGGMREVSEEERQRRLQICQTCPLYNAAKARCRICNCRLRGNFLNKLRWASERCPKGKW